MAIGDDRGEAPRRRDAPAGTPRALARKLAIVLALKLLALGGIWELWFAHPAPRDDDGAAAAAHVLDAPATAPATAHARRERDARR